jgi:hypothetical protein
LLVLRDGVRVLRRLSQKVDERPDVHVCVAGDNGDQQTGSADSPLRAGRVLLCLAQQRLSAN